MSNDVTDWFSCPAVERNLDVVSGSWVFKNSRVPVVALFENLRDGASVDEFIDWFPGIGKDQVVCVLRHIAKSLDQRNS